MNFCLVSQIVLDDLSRAREGFVLASDLHLLYLVTPISVDVEPDWQLYYRMFIELPAIDQVGNSMAFCDSKLALLNTLSCFIFRSSAY